MILTSATTSVNLNGVPGKIIHCKCGVRQCDPFFPLLYVMVGELMQIMVNEAWREGILKLPIDTNNTESYPIIQYADDTLIVLPADVDQIRIFTENPREIMSIHWTYSQLQQILNCPYKHFLMRDHKTWRTFSFAKGNQCPSHI